MTMTNPLPITPGRRMALVAGVPLILALIGWGAFSTVAAGGTGTFQVHHTFAIHDGKLQASVGDMDVTLVPGGGPDATLAGTVHYSLVKPSLTFTGSSVSLRCPVPAGECSLDSTMAVPPGTDVNLTSGIGDLTVDGNATGRVTLSTTVGDLTVKNLTKPAVLGSATGDITATGISAADVTATSHVGDITLTFTKPPRSLRVSDAVGDISIVLPPGPAKYDITANSTVGDHYVQPGLDDPGSSNVIIATSNVGDVNVSTAGD